MSLPARPVEPDRPTPIQSRIAGFILSGFIAGVLGKGAWGGMHPMKGGGGGRVCFGPPNITVVEQLKGIATSISPDRTRLISILLSSSRLPGHLSPDLWHSMLIILILLIHATTRQQ